MLRRIRLELAAVLTVLGECKAYDWIEWIVWTALTSFNCRFSISTSFWSSETSSKLLLSRDLGVTIDCSLKISKRFYLTPSIIVINLCSVSEATYKIAAWLWALSCLSNSLMSFRWFFNFLFMSSMASSPPMVIPWFCWVPVDYPIDD